MEILNYIMENAFVLIPVLLILGQTIKEVKAIPDKFIPLILLPFGIIGAMALCGWTITGAIQGVLVTGCAVYGNQIVKQLKKNE